MDCQHHGVILHDGYLYGTNHRRGNHLMCIKMETGELMWKTREVRQGTIVYADGMLYVYEGPSRGIVHLVKADPTEFQHRGSFRITEGNGRHWAHPAIVAGVLYIRHGDAIMAYDLKDKS